MASDGVYTRLGKSFEYILDDKSKVVKYTLERWDDVHKQQLDRAEKKRTRVVNSKTELYQLISLYILFQGIVLTVVARPSNLKCYSALGPALFSAIVSVAAIFAVRDKLLFYYDATKALISEEANARMTHRKISYVLSKGPSFKFEDMDKKWLPQGSAEAEGEDEESRLLSSEIQMSAVSAPKRQVRAQFQRGPEEHFWHIIGFLMIFSVLVFIYCFVIVCSH